MDLKVSTDNPVEILGVSCYLEFGRYQNKTIAISAFDMETGEPFCTCTVNWEQNWKGSSAYAFAVRYPYVVIKDYSENEGMSDCLRKAGVITTGAYMEGTGGGVIIGKLTDKWIELTREQFKYKQ